MQLQVGHLLNGERFRQGYKGCGDLPITGGLHDDAVTKKELWWPALQKGAVSSGRAMPAQTHVWGSAYRFLS